MTSKSRIKRGINDYEKRITNCTTRIVTMANVIDDTVFSCFFILYDVVSLCLRKSLSGSE